MGKPAEEERSGKMYESVDNENDYFIQIINIIKNPRSMPGTGPARDTIAFFAPEIFSGLPDTAAPNKGMKKTFTSL